ncbi:MAG TPA: hypothetical protein VLD64_04955 [Nitrosarchaeum sp.]|nr:hypothetical protein [Nitrosarchaeum sp.]
MSDMRYIIIGIVLIFSGFLILGVFGHNYQVASIQASEFGQCYEFHEDKEPVAVNCSEMIIDQILFFIFVIILIIGGIISLIKGVKGKWDNEVKPEDMVGPGNNKNTEKD